MRIFRVCPEQPYLRAFRKHHRSYLRGKPFSEQMEFYRRENVVLPGGWAAAMESEGFEVFETVYGDPALAVRWALDNGHSDLVGHPHMHEEILREMVRAFDPDVIYVYAGAFFRLPPDFRHSLRRCCSKKVIMTGFWGDELSHGLTYKNYFRGVDFIFCSSSAYEKKFAAAGIPAVTIGNCFDDTIVHTPAQRKKYDLVFSGTTGYGYPDHVGRYEKIIELMRKSRLLIWANEPNLFQRDGRLIIKRKVLNAAARLPYAMLRVIRAFSPIRRLRGVADLALLAQEIEVPGEMVLRRPKGHQYADYFLKAKPLRRLFPKRVRRLLMNASDYYTLVESSRMVINLHRDEDADIGNIRCYEVTGLGSLLLTDRGKELAEFLEPGVDFVPFETVDECVAQAEYFLAHPDELEKIARNGQRKVMAKHTVGFRCHQIAEKIRELMASPNSQVTRRKAIVDATYNLNHHPISYDISFFIQAAEIYRKMHNAGSLRLTVIWPEDIDNVPGVSKEADAAVGAAARAFRIDHICGQLANLVNADTVTHIHEGGKHLTLECDSDVEVIPYPPERDHHTVYYRTVMANPSLMTGFSASADANRYIHQWLDPLRSNRKLITITLRQYRYDAERNSNIQAWVEFAQRLDQKEYMVVIVPDTDHIDEFKASGLSDYHAFEPVCFDVDLRFALYEQAFLNMFINNGPCVAATLDKNVNYLLFKILSPSVPHCTEEFLKWSGFEIGGNPSYAGPYQKWVWEEDTDEVIWREFVEMRDKILQDRATLSGSRTQKHLEIAATPA